MCLPGCYDNARSCLPAAPLASPLCLLHLLLVYSVSLRQTPDAPLGSVWGPFLLSPPHHPCPCDPIQSQSTKCHLCGLSALKSAAQTFQVLIASMMSTFEHLVDISKLLHPKWSCFYLECSALLREFSGFGSQLRGRYPRVTRLTQGASLISLSYHPYLFPSEELTQFILISIACLFHAACVIY